MVVIWQSAATVFWMEYRRYVRTRRFWVLTLATLFLATSLGGALTLLAVYNPQSAEGLLGLRYSSALLLGISAWLPVIVASPLTTRMLRDLYKTRILPDLYLTDLHPLGVVLGRIGAIAALVGLSFLILTPVAMWGCVLAGLPLGRWLMVVPLALLGYILSAASESHVQRGVITPDEVPLSRTPSIGSLTFFTVVPVVCFGILGILSVLGIGDERLHLLPLFAFAPLTVPLTLEALLFHGAYGWSLVLIALSSALGLTLWFALAAAQWREWWSARVYQVMRWGGTALWLTLVAVHMFIVAQVFATTLHAAERLLLIALWLTTLMNLGIATLAGYFGLPRRADTVRLLVPYPLGGLLWQWALQWLSALVLYLTLGIASGQWVALERWWGWSFYVWAGGVVLPQAIQSGVWAYLLRYPCPTRGDFFCGYYINTRQTRSFYETSSQWVTRGLMTLVSVLGALVVLRLVIRLANSALFQSSVLDALADMLLRIHPWWGFYQEWVGVGGGERYGVYTLGWAVLLSVWWGRLGWLSAEAHAQRFIEWQRQVPASPSNAQNSKT